MTDERMADMPNAELAYQVLDHIDAHPEQWDQGVYIGKTNCGTVACFAGWTILICRPQAHLDFFRSSRVVRSGVLREESDRVLDEDGRWTSAREVAERLLGASSWVNEGEDDEEDLFDQLNTREDLGRLVEEIFGPRPV